MPWEGQTKCPGAPSLQSLSSSQGPLTGAHIGPQDLAKLEFLYPSLLHRYWLVLRVDSVCILSTDLLPGLTPYCQMTKPQDQCLSTPQDITTV